MHYTLDENNNPIECDIKEWGYLYRTKEGQARRIVAYDKFDGYKVSTVFSGFDHRFGFGDKPILFETMIFDKDYDGVYETRCCTWDDAVKMHKEAIEWIKNVCKDE